MPKNLSRMLRQALSAYQDGDPGKTARLCSGILRESPDCFDALHLLGLVHFDEGRMVEALRLLSAALRADPRSVDAMSNLGQVLHATGRYDEAIASYHRALQLAPGHPEILTNLANALLKDGRHDDALAQFDAALARKGDHVGALVNRGNTLIKLNRPVDAIASYDAALALVPRHPQILTNRGHALRRLDRPEEALAEFQAAIAAKPDFAEAHFETGMTQLSLGDFATGWANYEWRWKTGAFAAQVRPFKVPLWSGHDSIAGKTILLHAEQGFGDTLQFLRYVPLVVERGAKVVLEVQPELRSLLPSMPGVDTLSYGDRLPAFARHCPLMSLPLAFRTGLDSIPAPAPSLVADPERMSQWRDRLQAVLPPGRLRVGLVWSGRPTHNDDRNRSMALAQLQPLFARPGIAWVGLQTDMRDADRRTLGQLATITDLGGELRDFADTAAIIAQLDVVVSVDTAVAHLAGTLGKPVLILLPFFVDFRWMRHRDDTPWYPTATLYRQPAIGDWDSVIGRAGDDLTARGTAGTR